MASNGRLNTNGFIRKGGRLTILKQDSLHEHFVKDILPVDVRFPRMDIDNPSYPPPVRPSRNSFNINPERPGHPVFTGIDRTELRVWSDYSDWNETKSGFPAIYPVTDGFMISNKEDVGNTAVLANYSSGLEGIALAEFFEGNGSVMLSGFDLTKRAGSDPVADRLLRNITGYMAGDDRHEKYVLVDAPIRWGDYESEKGILTGIYSGFKLNSKPALFGSDENIPLRVDREGHMFAGGRVEWNSRPGKQYVPYGRRMFGPYYHRGFGGIAEPEDANNPIGQGVFWCSVPRNTRQMTTLVWNPAGEALSIEIEINGKKVTQRSVSAGAYEVIDAAVPANSSDLKVALRGDRRLVVLETSFK